MDTRGIGDPIAHELRLVDDPFIAALRSGEPQAHARLFDTHAAAVERALRAVLGTDQEIPDLVQDTFARVLAASPSFRGDRSTLTAWVTRIAVYTARGTIRLRAVRRRTRLRASPPEQEAPTACPELHAVVGRVIAVLEQMPAAERVPLALRWLHQMRIDEVAETCGLSRSTVKRRLREAERRFFARAQDDTLLRNWASELG